jgi:ABC-2 type transport system permease protein
VNKAGMDATQASLGGFFELGQLIIAVLGALTITSEYSTGMIRTSLTAMPRRGTVYAAKLLVFSAVTLVVSLITSFIAFFVGQAAMSGSGVTASLFHSVTIPANAVQNGPAGNVTFSGTIVISPGDVLTAIIGTALFVTVVALIAFGLGAIIRHTAGAITSAIGLMFVIPVIVQLLPDTWRWDIMRFFPDAAGRVLSVTVGQTNPHLWSAWPQFGVTLIYAAVLLGIGAYLFRKRDA